MSLDKGEPTIVGSDEEIRFLMRSKFKADYKIYAFYSSIIDRIITKQEDMVIPVYDRQVLKNKNFFLFKKHS